VIIIEQESLKLIDKKITLIFLKFVQFLLRVPNILNQTENGDFLGLILGTDFIRKWQNVI